MKKLITAAILAIACFSSASAVVDNPGPGNYHYEYVRIECPDGFVYEKFILVSNGAGPGDVESFKKYMENSLCNE